MPLSAAVRPGVAAHQLLMVGILLAGVRLKPSIFLNCRHLVGIPLKGLNPSTPALNGEFIADTNCLAALSHAVFSCPSFILPGALAQGLEPGAFGPGGVLGPDIVRGPGVGCDGPGVPPYIDEGVGRPGYAGLPGCNCLRIDKCLGVTADGRGDGCGAPGRGCCCKLGLGGWVTA